MQLHRENDEARGSAWEEVKRGEERRGRGIEEGKRDRNGRLPNAVDLVGRFRYTRKLHNRATLPWLRNRCIARDPKLSWPRQVIPFDLSRIYLSARRDLPRVIDACSDVCCNHVRAMSNSFHSEKFQECASAATFFHATRVS